jgi:glycogen phosphorylase
MEDELWEPLDPELWELMHNPWLVLLTASLSKLRSLMANPTYRQPSWSMGQGLRKFVRGITTNS